MGSDRIVNRASSDLHGLRTGRSAAGAGNGGRTAQVYPRPSLSPELNRLLSAAVVNARFRRMLLDDPATALAHGYNGEVFDIRPDEQAQVLAIRADTLAEFAAQLLERLWYVRLDARRRGTQETPANGVDQALLRREGPHRPKLGQDEARLCGPFLNASI